MSNQQSHHNAVDRQFADQANAYLSSAVHAQGEDLKRLTHLLSGEDFASVLDLGCGAGHASFAVAAQVNDVVAYDLSEKMLAVVKQAASDKGLTNLSTAQGVAESLPFENESFDIVISRYSAHHWYDVGQALREVKRVLKPGGRAIFMDVVSPGHSVLDVHLQTVEILRDTSHVRDYAPGEWLAFFTEAGYKSKPSRLTVYTSSLVVGLAACVRQSRWLPRFEWYRKVRRKRLNNILKCSPMAHLPVIS